MREPDTELNAAIARYVMQWRSIGTHLWQDPQTKTVPFTGHDPTRVAVPHTVFRPSADSEQARVVERRVIERGFRLPYLDALIHELDLEQHVIETAMETGYPSAEYARPVIRALHDATPAQRCRATLTAMQAPRSTG